MRVLCSPERLLPSTILCLGSFDGMHRGHQALVAACRRAGHASALATFVDHPASILAPAHCPPRLQTRAEREEVCAALGLDQLVYLPFDRAIAQMNPARFVEHFLLNALAPVKVVVGDDFRFGADRAGDAAHLTSLLAPHDIEVEVIAEQRDAHNARLSSTKLRQLIQAGALNQALAVLGRPYTLSGPVQRGDQRGRRLNTPTANLALTQCLPPFGVYAGWAGPRRDALFPAVANLGHHPTFGASESPKLEVHLLDAPADKIPAYGEPLAFHLIAHLRPERHFADAAQLKAAIAKDISAARALLTDESRRSIAIETLPTSH